jgi:hypothetical protein
MMVYDVKIKQDIDRLRKMQPKGFNALLKQALQAAALEWHRLYAPTHFTRTAYSKYGQAYDKPKRKGLPMVETGALRERVLKSRTAADVAGTSKRVYIKFHFGRPAQYTEEEIQRRILKMMKFKHCTYKQAQARVYSTAGYSQTAKAKFLRQIPALHQSEVNHLGKFIREHLVAELKKRGAMQTVRARTS